MKKEELQKLFKKYHDGSASESEKALLEAWYLEYNETGEPDLTRKSIKAAKAEIYRRLPGNEHEFMKIGVRLAAAAVLIGILIALTVVLLQTQKEASPKYRVNDIPPGGNKAILTLPSGKKLSLTDIRNGQIVTAGGLKVIKTKQGSVQLSYTDANDQPEQHTVSTPNGGQWQVRLADGTEVWLNAASALTFPSNFNKSANRIVTLKGEGYFEVAKDPAHPFIVLSGDQRVEVLGTHFNLSSYPEDKAIRTTLAEGRVKVNLLRGNTPKFLEPGQQSVANEKAIMVQPADLDEVLAWKNGYFQFDNESLRSLMPKLARWYNVEVKYDSNISREGLNGKVSRNKNISQVIKALEATGTVHFKVEGRRITVMK